ncbi:MAG: UDP-N-acetylglucosamine 2-epimerase (non-hydrolyzing) [Chloroflexi bacterium]|nr:UDP-N-acetylglucosamine 2-epimerase (non-hydrolyzing) [Chloroflexota bacterium]
MKVLTILGTRPEIIRLSLVIEKLDRLSRHVLVHTGQNFTPGLSDIFFQDLGIRQPDHFLGVKGDTPGEQIGRIIAASEKILLAEKPDRLLILGDTNSCLSAIVAKRMGIPVFHMEAGNRCFDDRVPEEVNRRLVDHSSDILMPYTERSRANLLREGIAGERIYVTGNPIYEVLSRFEPEIGRSKVLSDLSLEKGRFFLVTLHRAENVDAEGPLRALLTGLDRLQQAYRVPVIISTHPRTEDKIGSFGLIGSHPLLRFCPPFGFFSFIALERNALCVLSDSGTVQEECAIFRVPNVTLREVTERPETLECGSNLLSGTDPDMILRSVQTVVELQPCWTPPPEYQVGNVSGTVVRIVLGYHHCLAGKAIKQ